MEWISLYGRGTEGWGGVYWSGLVCTVEEQKAGVECIGVECIVVD